MRDHKVEHWSRIGRFRRSKWPTIGKQGSNLKFLNGRLLCDLTSDFAKVCVALCVDREVLNEVWPGYDLVYDVVVD
jgi:hypothetical protein